MTVNSVIEEILNKTMASITKRHVERHINPRSVEMVYNSMMYLIEVCPCLALHALTRQGALFEPR